MKKLTPHIILPFLFFTLLSTFLFSQTEKTASAVTWYTWEEAIEANKKKKKKIFVDVYTDWCVWCKKMDKNTFQDSIISAYLNQYFYPVKLNAEQKEDILYNGHTFKFTPNAGRRGVHELAYSILDGKMSYPTVVFFDEEVSRIRISPGYKDVKLFMKELTYTAENHYKKTSWEKFKSSE